MSFGIQLFLNTKNKTKLTKTYNTVKTTLKQRYKNAREFVTEGSLPPNSPHFCWHHGLTPLCFLPEIIHSVRNSIAFSKRYIQLEIQ